MKDCKEKAEIEALEKELALATAEKISAINEVEEKFLRRRREIESKIILVKSNLTCKRCKYYMELPKNRGARCAKPSKSRTGCFSVCNIGTSISKNYSPSDLYQKAVRCSCFESTDRQSHNFGDLDKETQKYWRALFDANFDKLVERKYISESSREKIFKMRFEEEYSEEKGEG